MQYEIKIITTEYAELIASLHYKTFKNFFLTSLGHNFLTSFYKGVISHKNFSGVGIFENNNLIGFAVGTFKNEGFYKSVIKSNLFNYSYHLIFFLFLKPYKLIRIFNNLILGKFNNFNHLPCLLSICVDDKYNNKGLGRILIIEFEKLLFNNEKFEYFLTTDAENNDRVNAFYLSNGFILLNNKKQYKNRILNYYYKKIL